MSSIQATKSAANNDFASKRTGSDDVFGPQGQVSDFEAQLAKADLEEAESLKDEAGDSRNQANKAGEGAKLPHQKIMGQMQANNLNNEATSKEKDARDMKKDAQATLAQYNSQLEDVEAGGQEAGKETADAYPSRDFSYQDPVLIYSEQTSDVMYA
jgi:hypothetical protein